LVRQFDSFVSSNFFREFLSEVGNGFKIQWPDVHPVAGFFAKQALADWPDHPHFQEEGIHLKFWARLRHKPGKMAFNPTFKNVFAVDLFRQLALMGMNSFEAKKTFPKKSTFYERKECSA
jgi:hypothetical protein